MKQGNWKEPAGQQGTGRTWCLKAGWLRIYVTRHIDLNDDAWWLHVSNLGIDLLPLDSTDIDAAKREALKIVEDKLRESLSLLPKVTPARVTPAQRDLLICLANKGSVLDEAMTSHVTPGTTGRIEKSLSLLARRGLIEWSGALRDATITEAGRRAIGR